MAVLSTVLRVLKHRWQDAVPTHRRLPAAALARIAARVQASEQRHTGEVCVVVESGLPLSYLLRGAPARERAMMLFGKQRVWDTEQNNGVLVYLLLAERSIELVADRGLNQHVPAAEWQAMVARLGTALHAGRFEEGLTQALEEVSAVLVQHFPLGHHAPRHNALPDAPLLLD